MPPRKMVPKTTKENENGKSSNKIQSGRGAKNKNSHDSKEPVEAVEPEIDVQAEIEEMLRESNEKILAVLQQRQENLCQTISQIDGIVNQPGKPQKK